MVDDIDDDDAYRIARGADIDPSSDRMDRVEIKKELEDRYGDFTQSQLDGFSNEIGKQIDRNQRTRAETTGDTGESRGASIAGELGISSERVELSGSGSTGDRTVMIKDVNGKYVTSASKLKTYTDSRGNTIGYPEGRGNEPGARKVIERPEE